GPLPPRKTTGDKSPSNHRAAPKNFPRAPSSSPVPNPLPGSSCHSVAAACHFAGFLQNRFRARKTAPVRPDSAKPPASPPGPPFPHRCPRFLVGLAAPKCSLPCATPAPLPPATSCPPALPRQRTHPACSCSRTILLPTHTLPLPNVRAGSPRLPALRSQIHRRRLRSSPPSLPVPLAAHAQNKPTRQRNRSVESRPAARSTCSSRSRLLRVATRPATTDSRTNCSICETC